MMKVAAALIPAAMAGSAAAGDYKIWQPSDPRRQVSHGGNKRGSRPGPER